MLFTMLPGLPGFYGKAWYKGKDGGRGRLYIIAAMSYRIFSRRGSPGCTIRVVSDSRKYADDIMKMISGVW